MNGGNVLNTIRTSDPARYLVLIAAFLQGRLGRLEGIAAILMATGILIAMVFGLALAKVVEDTIGEI